MTITSQEKFDEVFKGAKIFIVACERSDLCVFPEDDDETTEDSDDEETEEFEV